MEIYCCRRGATFTFTCDNKPLAEVSYTKGSQRKTVLLESRWWYLNLVRRLTEDVIHRRELEGRTIVYEIRWEGGVAFYQHGGYRL